MKFKKPEWSFTVQVDDLSTAPAHYKITADEDTCQGLAERYGIVAVDAASAHLTLMRERGGSVIHITGTVSADVVQECVVTLDPIAAHVTDDIEAYFTDRRDVVPFARAKAQRAAQKGTPIEVELIDEAAEPEQVVGGLIDLGEVAAQFLSLALDPYPRRVNLVEALPILGIADREGVVFGTDEDHGVEDGNAPSRTPGEDSPFAALKGWKDSL